MSSASSAGAADGNVLVDASNTLTRDCQLALGFTTSGAEELPRKARKRHTERTTNR